MPPSTSLPQGYRSRREAAFAQQCGKRQREHRVRRQVVKLLQESPYSGKRLAKLLGLAPRTLCDWKHLDQGGDWEPRPLGRPCKQPPPEQVQRAWQFLETEGHRVNVQTMRSELGLARCEAIDLKRDYLEHYRSEHPRILEKLTWHTPGAVWAIDHSKSPVPIDGRSKHILAVRDLASGMELAWEAVPDETSESAIRVLEMLFLVYGPPLVLKSDNGPAFTSEAWRRMLARWRITPLWSPPYAPWYNGACEAAHGAMKLRTEAIAACHGRITWWSHADLKAARRQANTIHRNQQHDGLTAQMVWERGPKVAVEDRARFARSLEKHRQPIKEAQKLPAEARPNKRQEAKLERDAVRQALEELGILSVTRRLVRLPIRHGNLADFS
jgi:transposase InsO family protein